MSSKLSGKRSWAEWCSCWGHLCAYCHKRPHDTIDHLVPLAHGGRDSVFNALPACDHCNQKKADQEGLTWAQKRDKLFTSRLVHALARAEQNRFLSTMYLGSFDNERTTEAAE